MHGPTRAVKRFYECYIMAVKKIAVTAVCDQDIMLWAKGQKRTFCTLITFLAKSVLTLGRKHRPADL